VASDAANDPLFAALRALRRDIAREAGVPPYVVFHDSTLREMAEARPGTLAALAEISGVGARKRDAYGDRFLAAIRDFDQG
jgi:ATP-dependent DNA helicase RecQ